jgi:hypothetical protein
LHFWGASLNDPPTYSLKSHWEPGKHHYVWPVGWGGVLLTCSPGLASNHDSLDLHLLISWGYRHEPPYLASFVNFTLSLVIIKFIIFIFFLVI